MANKYKAITALLKEDNNLSLELDYTPLVVGIKNTRYVSIIEPFSGNHVSRIKKVGFYFRARDTLEGLDLLERACVGEKDVAHTVSFDANTYNNTVTPVHGYSDFKSGIDIWIFSGFNIVMQNQRDGLISKIQSNYNEINNISSMKFNNVDDAVEFYEKETFTSAPMKDLRKGVLLHKLISNRLNWEAYKDTLLSDSGHNVVTPYLTEQYKSMLSALAPFELTKEAKDGLFVSMLLSNCYAEKPNLK
jgi:hypothetical protein